MNIRNLSWHTHARHQGKTVIRDTYEKDGATKTGRNLHPNGNVRDLDLPSTLRNSPPYLRRSFYNSVSTAKVLRAVSTLQHLENVERTITPSRGAAPSTYKPRNKVITVEESKTKQLNKRVEVFLGILQFTEQWQAWCPDLRNVREQGRRFERRRRSPRTYIWSDTTLHLKTVRSPLRIHPGRVKGTSTMKFLLYCNPTERAHVHVQLRFFFNPIRTVPKLRFWGVGNAVLSGSYSFPL